jgi:hypothetical protein
MSNTKQKKSIKSKPTLDFNDELFSSDITKISKELKKELQDQNLAWRFIDYKKYMDLGGYHPRGWKAYKQKRGNSDILDTEAARYGANPDGFMRRGTLVLAVRSQELNTEHKAYLKNRASRYAVSVEKQQKNELRQRAKEARLDTRIVDGYEDK